MCATPSQAMLCQNRTLCITFKHVLQDSMMRCSWSEKEICEKNSQTENNRTAANTGFSKVCHSTDVIQYDPYLADKRLYLVFKMQRSVCQNLTQFYNGTDLNINLIQGWKAAYVLLHAGESKAANAACPHTSSPSFSIKTWTKGFNLLLTMLDRKVRGSLRFTFWGPFMPNLCSIMFQCLIHPSCPD